MILIRNLRSFQIAKKNVSMNSWIEKNDKPKKILLKPWTAEEAEGFKKIERDASSIPVLLVIFQLIKTVFKQKL